MAFVSVILDALPAGRGFNPGAASQVKRQSVGGELGADVLGEALLGLICIFLCLVSLALVWLMGSKVHHTRQGSRVHRFM